MRAFCSLEASYAIPAQVPKGVFLAGSRSPFSRKHIAAQVRR